MSGEAIAIIGAAGGLLAILVPLLLTIRADVAEVRRDLHTEATAIRADVHALAERVARIEGSMSAANPWTQDPMMATPEFWSRFGGRPAPGTPPEETL